jgi:2,4-dienoyl-CoA reductase-like NADH-dependent reductase (Old Yellow Enzyme family)
MGKSAPPAAIDNLLERLAADEFSLVAVGRALLADAEWAHKVRDGRVDDIEPFTPEVLQTLL